MKRTILVSLALLCTAVSLPTYANTNGVYVQVTDEFYGYEDVRRAANSLDEWVTTVSHTAAYACNGGSSFTELPQGAGLQYCSRSAQVKLVWRRDVEHVSFISSVFGDPTFPESYRNVDDSDSGHCDTGEAVIWDVGASGAQRPWASMRDYCQYCAYTGGDCE